MRKFYFLLSLFLLSSGFINAQSFTVLAKDSSELPDTVVVMTDTSQSTMQDFYFRFKNDLPRETKVGVSRRLISGPINSIMACFGSNCYVFSSDTIDTIAANFSIEANAIYDEFHATITWQDDVVATCHFNFVFFNVDNSIDSVVVPVKIVISAEPSRVAVVSRSQEFSRPYPVPADKMMNFDYHIAKNGELVFYNILGSVQKRVQLDRTLTHVAIPVSDLKSGVYFYSFYVDGVKKTTNRMMIKH